MRRNLVSRKHPRFLVLFSAASPKVLACAAESVLIKGGVCVVFLLPIVLQMVYRNPSVLLCRWEACKTSVHSRWQDSQIIKVHRSSFLQPLSLTWCGKVLGVVDSRGCQSPNSNLHTASPRNPCQCHYHPNDKLSGHSHAVYIQVAKPGHDCRQHHSHS